MTLSKQILLGLLAGLAIGLFFGEKVSFLALPARAFIQLLQVTVLPYVVGALVTGIASGSPSQARQLASRGGLALAILWTSSLTLVFLSPLALPPGKGSSWFAPGRPRAGRRWGRLQALLPQAQVTPVHSIPAYIESPPGRYDAMFTGYARGAAFSLLHPSFSAVVPEPALGSIPVTVTVPLGEEHLLEYVNSWVEEQKATGLVEAKLDYWIHGEGAKLELGPRWSIGRDVLGLWP
jgi:hypothetical protein